MSVLAAQERVAELQALVARAVAGPPAAGAVSSTFATELAAATAAPAATPAVGAGAYEAEITAAAGRHGIDPALLRALVRQESGFDAGARSPAGAMGLTQLMPSTAASLGITDAFDPAQALDGGARYLRQQLDRFGGDEALALAAYNAGPGAVQRFGGIPPYAETQSYVRSVLAFADEYRTPAIAPAAPGGLGYSTI